MSEFLEKKKAATYIGKKTKDNSLATTQIDFQMGKMTPRRARALHDLQGWPIATSRLRFISAIGSPQRQGSSEIPEKEAQQSESRAF